MGRFDGPLHTLCEEGKWLLLSNILLQVLQQEALAKEQQQEQEQQQGEDKDYDQDHEPSRQPNDDDDTNQHGPFVSIPQQQQQPSPPPPLYHQFHHHINDHPQHLKKGMLLLDDDDDDEGEDGPHHQNNNHNNHNHNGDYNYYTRTPTSTTTRTEMSSNLSSISSQQHYNSYASNQHHQHQQHQHQPASSSTMSSSSLTHPQSAFSAVTTSTSTLPSQQQQEEEQPSPPSPSSPLPTLSPEDWTLARLQQELQTRQGTQCWTPLMISLLRAPYEILGLLLHCCPEAVQVVDVVGNGPLHLLCAYWTKRQEYDEYDQSLMMMQSQQSQSQSQHPKTINEEEEEEEEEDEDEDDKEEDDHHHHTTTTNNTTTTTKTTSPRDTLALQELLRLLVETSPQSVARTNRWGQTPVHCLLAGGIGPKLPALSARWLPPVFLQILLESSSSQQQQENEKDDEDDDDDEDSDEDENDDDDDEEEDYSLTALVTKDSSGRLPLHVACQQRTSAQFDIVSQCMAPVPHTALVTDAKGNLPLHLYAQLVLSLQNHQQQVQQQASSSSSSSSPTTTKVELTGPFQTTQVGACMELLLSPLAWNITATAAAMLHRPPPLVTNSNNGNQSNNNVASLWQLYQQPLTTPGATPSSKSNNNNNNSSMTWAELHQRTQQASALAFPEKKNVRIVTDGMPFVTMTALSQPYYPYQHQTPYYPHGDHHHKTTVSMADLTATSATTMMTMSTTASSSSASNHNNVAPTPTTVHVGTTTTTLSSSPPSSPSSGMQQPNTTTMACQAYGSMGYLPIHVACQFQCSVETLQGLLWHDPQSCRKPTLVQEGGAPGSSSSLYPLDLVPPQSELADLLRAYLLALPLAKSGNHRNHHHHHNNNRALVAGDSSEQETDSDAEYDDEVEDGDHEDDDDDDNVPAANSSVALTMESISPDQWQRWIQHIRRDAKRVSNNGASGSSGGSLSTITALVWPLIARSFDVVRVGQCITCLPPAALWKLTLVVHPLHGTLQYISVAATLRTIAQEAEFRNPTTTWDQLWTMYWFQFAFLKHLPPEDALSYSATCRQARSVGVRCLPLTPLRVTQARWIKKETDFVVSNNSQDEEDDDDDEHDHQGQVIETHISPPKPWQRLDVLVTPDVCHTIQIVFLMDYRNDSSSMVGGMLVVRDDQRQLRPNLQAPWGPAVVAATDPKLNLGSSSSTVCLEFPHVPGQTYGLWYYNPGPPGSSLGVSAVRVKQLLHACDVKGRSPLHILLSRVASTPERIPPSRLQQQVKTLLSAKFGTGDAVGDVPLHFALKCGVGGDVLSEFVGASPTALLETDKEGRTPMHAAFLLNKLEPPSIEIVKVLLKSPGENAIQLKDSSGRLPLHIAAERGCHDIVLGLLVEAYKDGCYRTDANGDLPLHLLVRSGFAKKSSVEILVQPIMHNETICKMRGSHGTNLPLHVAAEYLCSFKTLEALLQTYGRAAREPRTGPNGVNPIYALDLFEQGRTELLLKRHKEEPEDNNDDSLRYSNHTMNQSGHGHALQAVAQADFDLRSDLIFVYNATLINSKTGRPYRKETERIRRLEHMIRREAVQCGEERKTNRRAKLSDMTKQAWLFLCTFRNQDDPSDNYAGTVRRILRGLVATAVDVLAHVENPYSEPVPNAFIKDSATPACSVLIMSRLRFVGRYVMNEDVHPVHKSESCLVMRAKDYGLADEYARIMSIFERQEKTVEDDISDAGSVGSASEQPQLLANVPINVTVETFVSFANKLGLNDAAARSELQHYVKGADSVRRKSPGHRKRRSLDNIVTEEDIIFIADDESSAYSSANGSTAEDDETDHDVGKEAFLNFCRARRLDEFGVRDVVIKFMKSATQFQRETEGRTKLSLWGTTWPVVPVLDDYNVDRIPVQRRRDIDTLSLRDNIAETEVFIENRDELYAIDIQEKNASVYNFALYKYAIVMPAGDRDLSEISQHEELGISEVKDYMRQVGTALKELHSKGMAHCDLRTSNIVRFGKNLSLIDFDSACNLKDQRERMGSGSSKFCSGVLPPEMVERIDLFNDYKMLSQYENYWRKVSEDAKDLKLLTPDDIQTISSVVRSLRAKAEVARNVAGIGPSKTLRDELQQAFSGLENQDDWKDIISMALVSSSYEDLPYSLNTCESVDSFAAVWDRLILHSALWSRVRPRISADERYAYLIKTFNDTPDDSTVVEAASLPYELVKPSEQIDIWGFGALLFSLCANSSLYHLQFNGDLCDGKAFEELHGWTSSKAETAIRGIVSDPLAQDLLMRVLVTTESRMTSMDEVLRHPFFGPASSQEAQRILARHEEEQLIQEETVAIKRMTNAARRNITNSMERLCKIIHDQKKIVVPTCLVVLPYLLENEGNFLVVQTEADLAVAIQIGQHLIDMHLALARLSFWLMMKRAWGSSQSDHFKNRFKTWLQTTRTESLDAVAKKVLGEIGCDAKYAEICAEALEGKDALTSTLAFMDDPMLAARGRVMSANKAILRLCSTRQYLYLVDELSGSPVQSDDLVNYGDGASTTTYPIPVDPKDHLLEQLFLPFMSLSFMKVTNVENIEPLAALAKFLGVPPDHGVPKIWRQGLSPFVHSRDKPFTIAEFAVLHELLRRTDMKQILATGARGETPTNLDVLKTGDEMQRLEHFFRLKDPMRSFADLRRVSDGRDKSSAFWTSELEVMRMQSELELASVEFRLRELKKEWLGKQKVLTEIRKLYTQAQMLKTGTSQRSMQSSRRASPHEQLLQARPSVRGGWSEMPPSPSPQNIPEEVSDDNDSPPHSPLQFIPPDRNGWTDMPPAPSQQVLQHSMQRQASVSAPQKFPKVPPPTTTSPSMQRPVSASSRKLLSTSALSPTSSQHRQRSIRNAVGVESPPPLQAKRPPGATRNPSTRVNKSDSGLAKNGNNSSFRVRSSSNNKNGKNVTTSTLGRLNA